MADRVLIWAEHWERERPYFSYYWYDFGRRRFVVTWSHVNDVITLDSNTRLDSHLREMRLVMRMGSEGKGRA